MCWFNGTLLNWICGLFGLSLSLLLVTHRLLTHHIESFGLFLFLLFFSFSFHKLFFQVFITHIHLRDRGSLYQKNATMPVQLGENEYGDGNGGYGGYGGGWRGDIGKLVSFF